MNTLPLLLLVASAAWSSVLVSATRKEDLDAKMAEVFNSRRTSVPPPGGYVTKERSDRREREQSVDPAEEMTRHDMQKLKWWKDVKPSRLKSRLPHHKRPPNLMSPGVFNFRIPHSSKYYFHERGARIVKSSHFMKRYHLGRKISFVCVARGIPRPQITWLKDGLELNSYAGYEGVGINEWRLGHNRVKSKLEIDPAMPKDAGFYECLGDNKFAIDRRGFIAKYELN